ncbi:hypothetical protein L6164_010923 [Bauhinia variegata]|uniref:Uncharacterized protein n=1 Tax=Bauhinia variegata TaxID=167791 RepID=A0ACB9P459_BAUVA|nr:hypothetical protein L6164_010923 [Bauhinia variegata]
MDPWRMKKIESMKRYKRHEALDNLYFYLLTAFACSLFCCVTICLPYLLSVLRMVVFVCIPGLISMLMSSKLLFILGNLIIVVLIVDSRIFSSNSSLLTGDVYYDEYMKSRQAQRPARKMELEHGAEDDATQDLEENVEPCDSESEELNRRADDYIARVNRQRRLEVQLSLVQCGSY